MVRASDWPNGVRVQHRGDSGEAAERQKRGTASSFHTAQGWACATLDRHDLPIGIERHVAALVILRHELTPTGREVAAEMQCPQMQRLEDPFDMAGAYRRKPRIRIRLRSKF